MKRSGVGAMGNMVESVTNANCNAINFILFINKQIIANFLEYLIKMTFFYLRIRCHTCNERYAENFTCLCEC